MRASAARVGLYCLRLIVASQVRACRDACRRGLPSISFPNLPTRGEGGYSQSFNCRGPRLCGFGLGGYWSSLTIVVPGYEDSGPGGTGPRLFCGPRLCRCGLRGYWSSLTSSIQIPFLPTAGSRRWVAGYWSSLTQRWVLAYPAMGRGATGPRLRVLRTSTEYGGSRWRRTTVTRTRSEGLPD